jgi:hypothetical protein
MNGFTMPVVNEVTIAVNAVPMTTATDNSTTLPRIKKSLKPFNIRTPSDCDGHYRKRISASAA